MTARTGWHPVHEGLVVPVGWLLAECRYCGTLIAANPTASGAAVTAEHRAEGCPGPRRRPLVCRLARLWRRLRPVVCPHGALLPPARSGRCTLCVDPCDLHDPARHG